MSGGASDEDKQHEPTQKKLDDARKKGEVPRSTDLMTAAAYGGLLLVALGFGAQAVDTLSILFTNLIRQSPELSAAMFSGGAPITAMIILTTSKAVIPWFAVPAALVLASLIAQQGLVFASEKLKPKISRVSLISNAKNKFGRNGLFEFAKSTVKLTIYSVLVGMYLSANLPQIMMTLSGGAGPATLTLANLTLSFLSLVLVISLVIGVVDMVWQKQEHLRKNRMSRKEVTDEAKQQEGDPQLKNQRRQRGYEIAMNQMLSDVPDADVVIVNPTHYAVALKWTRKPGAAPVCVAKGVDEIAARIREIAAKEGVPIHSDPPTARALHATVEVDQEIHPDQYRAVAAAIRFAEAMRARARKGGF